MKPNIGTFDRLFRAGIAILLLIGAWWWSSWILLAVSFFSFYEALAGWCAFYQLLGKSSCPVDLNKKN